MRPTVLIFGSGGQDGREFLDNIVPKYDLFPVCVSRQRFIPERGTLIEGKSVINLEDVEWLLRETKPAFVVNFAGISSVYASWQTPTEAIRVNAIGVSNILSSIHKICPSSHFFNAGSVEQLSVRNPYGLSKKIAGDIVSFYRSQGVYAVQGILGTHEGIYRDESFVARRVAMYVAEAIYRASKGKEPRVLPLGNIHVKRDWSAASAVVDGVWKMLNMAEPEDLFLCSGRLNSVADFALTAYSLGFEQVEWKEHNEELSHLYGTYLGNRYLLAMTSDPLKRAVDPDHPVIDMSTTFAKIGWKATETISDIAKKMVEADLRGVKERNETTI